MTDAEREALIEKMARDISRDKYLSEWELWIYTAAAALAIAEPIIRKDAVRDCEDAIRKLMEIE